MDSRKDRGYDIAWNQDSVRHTSDRTYRVRSQGSPDVWYDVVDTGDKWTCSCPDHQLNYMHCKHMYAVEISRRVREAVANESRYNTAIHGETVISAPDIDKCTHCGSDNAVRHGIRKLKRGTMQRFKCMDCLRHFTRNLGFEGKHATPEQITMAVDLMFSGLSCRKTASAMRGMDINVSYQTIMNWATEYGRLMDKFMDNIMPHVGEAWRTDEVYLSISGQRKYLFAMLDTDTRFWIAKMVADHKGNDDVAPMFKEARRMAGKVPSVLISDTAKNFHHAWRNQYRAKNFTHKQTEHIYDISFDGKHHNNQMESFNGNTIKHREKVTRGLKKDDSIMITGIRLNHNYVRPHQGLPGHITPAEAAGIRIEGDNKYITMIRAATDAGMAA